MIVIYNVPGLLMILGGALAGFVGSSAELRPAAVAIIAAGIAGCIDFGYRWRIRDRVSTDYGAMIDPGCGGMLYYCPIWILGVIVSSIGIYFLVSS